MANSKDGQGHKDKYLDTSRKNLLQRMRMCHVKSLRVMANVNLKEKNRSKGLVPTDRFHMEYSYEI